MTSLWNEVCRCFRCKQQQRPANRTVYVGNKHPHDEGVFIPELYPDNKIISSRYTLWNFLPKNLFEQFRRVANFYFLCVGIVQLTIDTPVSPITSILPLVFVITCTAIKQGYEDWLRHKSDREVNDREVQVIRDGQLTTTKSMHIKVGDIVRVQSNKGFPCDMIMLSSVDPDGNCYITTANLDGETNLKTHCCLAETKRCVHEDDFQKLTAFIECEQPIPDLYSFVGNLNIVRDNGERIVKPLGPENVLLRGARLKNTPFIYGCAIYTGQETKMALNSNTKVTKFSRVERRMNTFLLIFLVILLAEAVFSTCLKYWYVFRPIVGQPWYVPQIEIDAQVTVRRVFEDFLAYIVLYNYVIPISLYVTIELQKFVGSMFFAWDVDMFDPGTNERAKANTSDLNEELGQVEYLFTDKTGTLTENDMQFRMCSINGKRYEELGGMLCETSPAGNDPNPVPVLSQSYQHFEEMETFLTVLVLCHNIRVDHPQAVDLGASSMYSYGGYDYEYQASSPDEKAFVEACRRFGVVFHGTHDERLEITFKGEMRRYKLLHSLEFDPTRKRMSVIVQNENDEIYLLSKGAETAILDRVIEGDISSTLLHVNEYAVLGLRTLVIAMRRLESQEYTKFDQMLSEARKSLTQREVKLAEAFDYVEKNFKLLGATAVEDKLQDDVPETIQALLTAGIKVWVLTGDKEETAVNISHSAGHFSRDMLQLKITQMQSGLDCADLIRKHSQTLDNPVNRDEKFAIVIDGTSLAYCLIEHADILRDLCMKCSAVLCCRMTPLQKAEVVKLIKNSRENPVTAAIGDGANDVSMIEEAHVGLGIMGKEGRQAVRNSDYAFAKFRFLMKALLVHGHFYYIRIANLVQYFFYKNVAFITAQLFYTFFSAFSEQTLYESWYLMNFNMVFTAFPILMYGIFEQHLKPSLLMGNPKLYRKISRNENMSIHNFILWNGSGLWHCVVMFFGTLFLLGEENSLFSDGKMIGNWSFGSIVYFGCLVIVCLKLSLSIYYWSLPIWLSFAFSAFSYFVGTAVYNSVLWPDFFSDHNYLFQVWNTVFTSGGVWFAELVLIVLALLPDIIYRCYKDISLTMELGQQRKNRADEKDKFTINFTKSSGKLTISQINIIEDYDNHNIDFSTKDWGGRVEISK
ncbi:phospholipid-transporting ATPase IF-like isoform X3 [Ruditapes philippinarum]|uniref:phospholipid-transporting ATPase IF-like isoform X3 n=1 Tax=Ruditapes philippinarum TaxID=129788 RepID=UPI00295B4ABE|nr:phospholipid-transporting ATPase IF-like isoform X3 [Ruditapes philippinarum]